VREQIQNNYLDLMAGSTGVMMDIDRQGIHWADSTVTIAPGNLIVGEGTSPFGSGPPPFKIIGCRLRNTVSVYMYFDQPDHFTNQLLTYIDLFTLLGVFTSMARYNILDAGVLVLAKRKDDTWTRVANSAREYIGIKAPSLAQWDISVVDVLIGKWKLVQKYTEGETQHSVEMEVDLTVKCKFGVQGTVTTSLKDGEEWVRKGEVLCTINEKDMIGLSILVLLEDVKVFTGQVTENNSIAFCVVAELNRERVSLSGQSISRSGTQITTGDFSGHKIEIVKTETENT